MMPLAAKSHQAGRVFETPFLKFIDSRNQIQELIWERTLGDEHPDAKIEEIFVFLCQIDFALGKKPLQLPERLWRKVTVKFSFYHICTSFVSYVGLALGLIQFFS